MNGRQSQSMDSGERHAIPQRWTSAIRCRFSKPLHDTPTVGFDDALRGDVVFVRRDLDERQPLLSYLVERQRQRLGRVSATALPWYDGIADVAQARWRQLRRPRTPAE